VITGENSSVVGSTVRSVGKYVVGDGSDGLPAKRLSCEHREGVRGAGTRSVGNIGNVMSELSKLF
jgi:hypothetical protein